MVMSGKKNVALDFQVLLHAGWLGVRSRTALDVYQADITVEELFSDDMCVRRGRRGWKSSPYFCFVIIVRCCGNVVVMSVSLFVHVPHLSASFPLPLLLLLRTTNKHNPTHIALAEKHNTLVIQYFDRQIDFVRNQYLETVLIEC